MPPLWESFHTTASPRFRAGGGQCRSICSKSSASSLRLVAARFSRRCSAVPALGIATTPGLANSHASATCALPTACLRPIAPMCGRSEFFPRRTGSKPSAGPAASATRAAGRTRLRAARPSSRPGRRRNGSQRPAGTAPACHRHRIADAPAGDPALLHQLLERLDRSTSGVAPRQCNRYRSIRSIERRARLRSQATARRRRPALEAALW